jgi:protocatechuate 3,4-dioxygenase beta subunit
MTDYPRESLAAHPQYLHAPYASTILRSPKRPLIIIPQTLSELTGPMYGHEAVAANDTDLTRQHSGEPLGERIIVTGMVVDEDGRPIPNTLIEIWQANAAGRYVHVIDQHPAPLDPNFSGAGRCVTDAEGRYRFTTIKPGAYPWKNHHNAWRPNHIHFSLFGPSFLTRLVTQMYFPGDPLIPLDPIANSVTDPKALQRMICAFDIETTVPEWALGYRFDFVLRGRNATPFEEPHDE